jgi:hypothetical protein
VNRFEAKPGTKSAVNDVGPGSYDAKLPASTVKPPKPAKKVGFAGGADRWNKGNSLKVPEDNLP